MAKFTLRLTLALKYATFSCTFLARQSRQTSRGKQEVKAKQPCDVWERITRGKIEAEKALGENAK